MKKPKGSTVIIACMYATWIGYLLFQVWCFSNFYTFLPSEVTFGTAALFIVETVSLARLKMAKEGQAITPKASNAFLNMMGVGGVEDFEDEVQSAQRAARHAKEG